MPPAKQFIARRSESDMLAMRPITITLGKNSYIVELLNNKKAAEWRDKLYNALGPLVSGFDFSAIDLTSTHDQVSAAMSAKLSQELIAYPQNLVDLLFAYAPNLPAETIREEATDEQICLAFSQVAEVGYPFFFHLWATKRALSVPPQKMPETPATSVQ
jgi:hypothetical protein